MMKFCDCRCNDALYGYALYDDALYGYALYGYALYDDALYGTAGGCRGGRRGFPGPFGVFRLCVSATLGTLTVLE